MSTRIYTISKEIGMENKELLALLKERGFDVKSASSTINNIDAESIIEEFKSSNKESKADDEGMKTEKEEKPEAASSSGDGSKKPAPVPPARPSSAPPPPPPPPPQSKSPEAPAKTPESKGSEAGSGLPSGVFVKSKDDLDREKAAAEEAKKEASGAKPSAPPPPPPARRGPPPPPPTAGRPPMAPPPPPARRGPGVPPPPPSAAPRPPATSSPESTQEEKSETPSESPEKGEDAKILQIKPPIVVRDFANLIGVKPFRLISELMEMNIFAAMNQTIEEEVASEVAAKHGFLLEVKHRGESAQGGAKKKEKPKVDESKLLKERPPVVCILGHVDHGKTTLLDRIRSANVVKGEFGGITQHIGGYQVEKDGKLITFLDTPGHAAFNKMRARGAELTDIAILVVAADDGFMPQTDEALKFAREAEVPVIVAINKIDTKGANLDRVKQQMQERNLAPEEWGGETITVAVSALKGEGIDQLLEMINLQTEIMELKANPDCPAEGSVVEAQVEVGRGASATVIIQKGTLKQGDALVCGTRYAKARALFDDKGKNLKAAPPSTPVRIIGWSDAPEAGATFKVVKNEKVAKAEAAENLEIRKRTSVAEEPQEAAPTVDDLFAAIASTQKKTLRAVLKCDVQGSLEAVKGMLEAIQSDKVDVEVVAGDVGLITKNDVMVASTSGAVIIGFNVRQENGVTKIAKHHGVEIYQHNIIYELFDQVKEAMAGLLDPILEETKVGAAEVRQVFPVGRAQVAGCLITQGHIRRDAAARVLRKGEIVFEGKISTLKRFKEDATEVRAGYECGIGLDRFNDFSEGDSIETFQVVQKRPSL
ncbi:MAG: translation initiation factor IF-2 [Opitutales bacterium]|nr:translation initiation factor IF-2 [Opitutales bacterium]